MFTAWSLLMAGIVVELVATALLPRTSAFRDPGWTVTVLAGYALSIWLLALAVKRIPVDVAYAVWSGVGTAGIVVLAAVFLGERLDAVKAAAVAMIVVGVVLLNMRGAA